MIYHELVMTSQEYMRNVITVERQWLIEIAPHFYRSNDFKAPKEQKRKRQGELEEG